MKNYYIRFYVRDWLCSRRVLNMSGDAVKAYLYLLMESWLQEPQATLPSDPNELASMTKLTREKWDTISYEVMPMFTEWKDGRIYNERLMEELGRSKRQQRFGNKNASHDE